MKNENIVSVQRIVMVYPEIEVIKYEAEIKFPYNELLWFISSRKTYFLYTKRVSVQRIVMVYQICRPRRIFTVCVSVQRIVMVYPNKRQLIKIWQSFPYNELLWFIEKEINISADVMLFPYNELLWFIY